MVKVCEDWFPMGSFPKQRTPGFEMDNLLKQNLDVAIKNVTKDWDFAIIISGSGEVRVGKSALALQIGTYWTHQMEKVHGIKVPFNSKENIIFQWDKLIEQGNNLGDKHKYCCLIYDEAGETMEGTKSATMELRAIKDFLRECGQYNFLNIFVMPEFFAVPSSIAINRSTLLLDVTYSMDSEGMFRRGQFSFYSKRNKKLLYLKGKKFLDYGAQRPDFRGYFNGGYGIINEDDYRTTKKEALRSRDANSKDKVNLILNSTFFILNKLGYSTQQIADEVAMLNRGVSLMARNTISRRIQAYNIEKPLYSPFVQANHILLPSVEGDVDGEGAPEAAGSPVIKEKEEDDGTDTEKDI